MRQMLAAVILFASAILAGCQTQPPEYVGYCKWRAENAGLCGDSINSGGFRRR
jgi:hypothetical protein